ncbi:mechanosensitive ion channel [Christiangramia portivictoriae]|uniref:mechanosensitive ion channel n=1 Tax=Christiangramia portivictoriae TaxID=326069 RepID=UPI0004207B8D|nr:mechanosensitive ion channel [Christiangramia portivictoriae]
MRNELENIADRISDFLPDLLGALLVLLIGWLIAKGIKAVIVRLLKRTRWDERVFGKGKIEDTNVFLANIVYYVIMIIVILIVLEILGVDQVLTPLENMVNEFLSFIPNLVAAILIGFIGYILAKFVSNLINIGGTFLDSMVDKTGFKDTDKLINILKKVVFIVIFIPFLIQAFNALELDAISGPANDILADFTALIGEILIAGIILAVFIWGGKYLANFLEDLFRSMGLDRAAEKIHIHNMIGRDQSLSKIVANLVYFFLVFFGIITAVEIIGLTQLTEILDQILMLTGQILFGLIILAVGNYISLLIYNSMSKADGSNFVAKIVRWASLALFLAIALETMGIANEIVELAFGLTLGAIAVAVALSYGLGGREAAGEHFKEIVQKLKDDNSNIKHGGSTNPPHTPSNTGNMGTTGTTPDTGTRPGNINDPANPNRPDNPSPGRSDENRLDL